MFMRGKLILLLLAAISILLIVVAVQADILSKRSAKIKELETDVSELIRGIGLTESLRKANSDLDRFQADIREDLVDAPDYDDPLSDHIIGAYERLWNDGKRTVGPVR